MSDDRMITLAEAETLTGKSQPTLYRIIKKHGIPTEKRREGKTERNYISYRKIMAVLAQSPVVSVSERVTMATADDRYTRLLEEQNRELKERIKELERSIDWWKEKFLATTAEKEALLRGKGQGIAGYLISKIWSQG